MVSIPLVSTSKGILAVGSYYNYPNKIYSEFLRLNCPEGQDLSNCHWDEFLQKFQVERLEYVVIPLPVTYEVPCNIND